MLRLNLITRTYVVDLFSFNYKNMLTNGIYSAKLCIL